MRFVSSFKQQRCSIKDRVEHLELPQRYETVEGKVRARGCRHACHITQSYRSHSDDTGRHGPRCTPHPAIIQCHIDSSNFRNNNTFSSLYKLIYCNPIFIYLYQLILTSKNKYNSHMSDFKLDFSFF